MIDKLILGTVQLGLRYGINNTATDLMSCAEANEILALAHTSGIQMLDTAADYGDSEIKIGNFILKQNKKSFDIITKFSKKEGVEWKESLSNSLKKMNVPNMDIIMFHSFEAYINAKNNNEIDSILKYKGSLFSKLGVSVYTNKELAALKGDIYVDVVQCPFNLLDNHNIRSQYLIDLQEDNKIIHTRSVFLQGLFFMDIKNIPNKLKSLTPILNKIHNIANDNNISIGHLAQQYVLSKKYIDGILIGVDSVEQLKKNIRWANILLDSNIFGEIDKIFVNDTMLLNPSKW